MTGRSAGDGVRPGGTADAAWRRWSVTLSRLAARHRRALAALAAFVAVAAGLTAVAPGPGPTTPVLVTTKDVAPGAVVSTGDVTVAALPAGAVPRGALRSAAAAVGRLVTGPVRKGEVVTDVRLVGPALTAALSDLGLVAAPVRLADPGVARVVRAGDRVDVLAAVAPASAVDGGPALVTSGGPGTRAASTGRTAQAVAIDALVVAVPPPEQADGTDGGLVILAVPPMTAAGLAQAAVAARLTVSLRGG